MALASFTLTSKVRMSFDECTERMRSSRESIFFWVFLNVFGLYKYYISNGERRR